MNSGDGSKDDSKGSDGDTDDGRLARKWLSRFKPRRDDTKGTEMGDLVRLRNLKREFWRGANMLRRRKVMGASFMPKTGKILNVEDREHALELYAEIGNGTDPVYIIGVTNNVKGEFTDKELGDFIRHFKKGHTIGLGTWTSGKTKKYDDVSIFSDSMGEEEQSSQN